jgi:hypothetical protein
MKKQIPHGDEDRICPLHKEPMSQVCHKCPLWIKVRGKDPQSFEEFDRWDCAWAWLPLLLVDNTQQVRQGAAATESFRNEMVQIGIAQIQHQRISPPVRLIDVSPDVEDNRH